MTHAAPLRTKIPTKIPQPASAGASRPTRPKARRAARSRVFASGAGRPATRGDGNPVIELEYGITVYPARKGQGRWRAVWYENSTRRQCEAVSEEQLAARLETVTERLAADAPNMERTGAELIAHYLDPDRLPADRRWSRKHAHTQRRLCERFAAPVIGGVACQDIKTWHMQQVVNAAPTAKEGARVHGMISALVAAGIEGGYLANPRLAKVHWQAAGRPLPPPRVGVAGESGLWVDPGEIPSAGDVERDQLMANVAAYSGLRWGEIAALTVPQADTTARVITVDRKVIEVAGHLYVEAPKNRKRRQTVYPRTTPSGYPLAERLAARIEQARAEQDSGINPLGLIFPSPHGPPYW
jgi:integrase